LDDPHPNNNKDSTLNMPIAWIPNHQQLVTILRNGFTSPVCSISPNSSMIAAKVSFRLTKQSTGGSYCQTLLQQPMDGDLFAM
jgi:hypothetical protein